MYKFHFLYPEATYMQQEDIANGYTIEVGSDCAIKPCDA